MRGAAEPYWKALGAVAVVEALGNAVVTNVFVTMMTPQNWAERALPALGWALVLTAMTIVFVLISTVWLRRRTQSHRVLLALLALAGPAVAWALIGLIIGDWLFPLYAFYGLGAGVVASGVLSLTLRMLTQSNVDRPGTVTSAEEPAQKAQTG